MATLFDIVNKQYFNVLAAKNKELYLECLFLLQDHLDQMTSEKTNTKQKVIEMIADLLDSKIETSMFDDEDELIPENSTNKDKAAFILNLLIKRQWLYMEDLGDYQVAIHLYTHSVKVLRVLREIEANEQTEYTGLISVIHAMVTRLSKDDIGQFEQMYKRTDELVSNLKTLRSNIYMQYSNMLKSASKDKLMELFDSLIKYKQAFFDKAFYNLMTKDTLKKYKLDILNGLKRIIDDDETIDRLAQARINDKFPTIEDAREFVISKTYDVIEAFENIDRLNQSISEKAEMYLNVTISKIRYLLNRSGDFEGTFNRMFERVLSSDHQKTFGFVRLTDTRNLDHDSLYVERRAAERIAPVRIALSQKPLDQAMVDKAMQELKKNQRYSIRTINHDVLQLLNGKDQVIASETPLETYDDYVRLILIYLYSRNDEAIYTSEPLGIKATVNKVSFSDFVIKRRKRK